MNYDGYITRLRNEFLKAYKSEDILQALLSGEKMLEAYKEKGLDATYKYAEDLFNVAYVYEEDMKEERAIELYTQAADLILNIQGRTAKLGDIFNNLAIIYARQGKYEPAISYFKKAVEIRSEVLADNHPDRITVLYNMGSAYYDKGDYKKALTFYTESLKRRDENEKDMAYADNLNAIGYCHQKRGNLKEALKYLEEALNIVEDMEGGNSVEYMSHLYYMADIYERNDMLDKARETYNDAIALIKEHMGEKHPYYAEAINKLSGVYVKQNCEQKAMMLRLKAVNIIKKTVGTNHIYYANCLRGLGELYMLEKDYVKAGLMYGEVLDIKKKVVGVDHIEYVSDALVLCNIYCKQDKVQKAIDQLNFLINNVSPENSLYKECLLYLVKVYGDIGEGQKMYEIYDLFIKIEPEKSFDDMLAEASEIE